MRKINYRITVFFIAALSISTVLAKSTDHNLISQGEVVLEELAENINASSVAFGDVPFEFRDDYKLSLREIYQKVHEVLSSSYRLVMNFTILNGGLCEQDTVAYVLRDSTFSNIIFICPSLYRAVRRIEELVRERNKQAIELLRTGKEVKHNYIGIKAVVMRYLTSTIIHEYLHLLGFEHGSRMWRKQHKVFSNHEIEDFHKAPHPEFSDWAIKQLTVPRDIL